MPLSYHNPNVFWIMPHQIAMCLLELFRQDQRWLASKLPLVHVLIVLYQLVVLMNHSSVHSTESSESLNDELTVILRPVLVKLDGGFDHGLRRSSWILESRRYTRTSAPCRLT